MENDFWASRASLRTPIPEVGIAADLLAMAVESLLLGDSIKARSYLVQADLPALRAYTRSIQSEVTREVHRVRDVPGLPRGIPRAERGLRQPSRSQALEIYRRDGFRCRYCGCRIILPAAQSVLSALVPGAVRWGSRDDELNAAFYTLKGVLDHVDPHAHGGGSDPENLVVACQPCNYGKGNWFIQQIGISDPRLRPPQVDEWDGLSRILRLRSVKIKATTNTKIRPAVIEKHLDQSGQPRIPKTYVSITDFAAAFSAVDRRHFDTLMQILDECVDLGVHWKLGRVFLVKVQVGTIDLHVLGIDPGQAVEIPWFIGPYKQAFRPFAEMIAAGVPGGAIYETDKMWRVKCFDHRPLLSDLVNDPTVLRDAFNALHHSLRV